MEHLVLTSWDRLAGPGERKNLSSHGRFFRLGRAYQYKVSGNPTSGNYPPSKRVRLS
jgi:hypothetical protein